MLGHIYETLLAKLEYFRDNLRRNNIGYYIKCARKQNSCMVFIVLRHKITHKRVLHLNLKIRSEAELSNTTGTLENLLSSCAHFTIGHSPNGSPEY